MARGQLHLLIIHIEARGTHIAQHICIHHRTLGSILEEDLDKGLIYIGLLSRPIQSYGYDACDAEQIDPPETQQVEEYI